MTADCLNKWLTLLIHTLIVQVIWIADCKVELGTLIKNATKIDASPPATTHHLSNWIWNTQSKSTAYWIMGDL